MFNISCINIIICSSISAQGGMSEAIEAVLHRHRELLLRTDVRAYPSRSFKQGASWQHLEPMSDLIVDLVNTGKLLQTQVEKAIDKLDISMKGAIKMLVTRTSLVYDAYKKDLAFVLRLMAAHLLMKRQAWADSKKLGRTPRSHPEWAIQAYLNITEASSTMSADLASLSSSASTASQHSSASTADANIRAMILAGRDAGVAFFPGFSDTLGDDEEDGIEEDDEDQGQDNEHISCKYWGPKLKKAVDVMQNGMIKYSSKFEASAASASPADHGDTSKLPVATLSQAPEGPRCLTTKNSFPAMCCHSYL